MKTHLAVSEQRPNGAHWTGTLCGFQSSHSQDGANAETDHSKVSCKKCLAIMADSNHWRHRRFVEGKLIQSQAEWIVPIWNTHSYHREGGHKIHLVRVEEARSTKVTLTALCKRKVAIATRGEVMAGLPDLEKWLAGGEDQVCKLCLHRARGNMPVKGGTNVWGGPLAKPE